MGLIRIILGVPVAGAVTVALFLLMTTLIGLGDDIKLEEDSENIVINITRQIEEIDFNRGPQEVDRPELDTPPPPPPNVAEKPQDIADVGTASSIPDFEPVDTGSGFNPDRNVQPLVRIEPQYPERCLSRADDEENVRVEIDVDENGDVADVRIIDSTNSCFDREVIRAVRRWKYQPKVQDGKAVPRAGVRTTLTFRGPED